MLTLDLGPVLPPIPHSILHCKEPRAYTCGHFILHIQTPSSALDHPGPGGRWYTLGMWLDLGEET